MRAYCSAGRFPGRKESEGGARGRRREPRRALSCTRRLPTWRAAGRKVLAAPCRPRGITGPKGSGTSRSLLSEERPQRSQRSQRSPESPSPHRRAPRAGRRPPPKARPRGGQRPREREARQGERGSRGGAAGEARGSRGEPRGPPTCPSPPRRASGSARPATGPPSCRGAQRGDAASEPRT